MQTQPMLTKIHQYVRLLNENNFHLTIAMTFTQSKIASILRHRGYKLTPQRRAVLNIIAQSHDHLTPAAIYEKVHQEHPHVGLVTVYRTLDILAELGLICEVHAGGSCRSYLMRRPSEHHHHLICSECGAVIDFTDCDLSNLEQRLARETHFEIEGHLLEFTGRCRNCRKRMKQKKAAR
jgi:Fur family ferric uptake transcriptional regulator